MTYQHPNADGNLTGVHNAMRYDADGEPSLRVSIENIEGNANSGNGTATSAFGEPVSIPIVPVFQLDGLYGIDGDEFQLNTGGSGTTSVDANGLMTVSSGVGAPGSFASLRSKRSVRYRPGQGSMARFTAMWETGGVAGYQQVAGFVNQSDILAVGYNDTNFGIVRRYNSKGEIAKFVIDVPAGGAETLTVKLNDVDFTVNVTSGTAEHNATEIGNETYTGWIVDYVGNTLYFLYNGPPTNLTGAFSITSTGALSATHTALQNGAAPTDTWIYQADFNIDKLDGTGPSGMNIDTTKLNVFQIDFRWLGAGVLRFAVESPTTGELITFHKIHYTNQNIVPSISNPSMRIGYAIARVGAGVATDCILKGASMMGAIQGEIHHNISTSNVRKSITTNLSQNVLHHFFTLKNDRINESGTNGKLNQKEVILHHLSGGATASSTQVVEILLYKNAVTAADKQFVAATSATSVSTTVTTLSSGTLIAGFAVSTGSTLNEDLEKYRIILAPNETISFIMTSTAQMHTSNINLIYSLE